MTILKKGMKSLLWEASFEFEVASYFIKLKSGTTFRCTLVSFIEDPEFGKWLRLENVWETSLWSETGKSLPVKPGSIIEIRLDEIEVMARG